MTTTTAAVDFPQVVRTITSSTLTEKQLAEVAHVKPPTVRRWLHGVHSPLSVNEQRVRILDDVLAELRHTYTQDGAVTWLFGRNAHFGGRIPYQLLLDDAADDVLGEARRLAGSM